MRSRFSNGIPLYLLEHKHCEVCGKVLFLHNNRDMERKRFCSKSCLAVATHSGRTHTPESIVRMRHPHNGYTVTDAVRQAQLAKGLKQRGRNSNFYRNGSTPETRLRTNRSDWRYLVSLVLERDSYICQKCGITDCKLTVHHIIPWVLTHNDSMLNLVTLCKSCHAKEELKWTPILVKLNLRKEFTNVSSRI